MTRPGDVGHGAITRCFACSKCTCREDSRDGSVSLRQWGGAQGGMENLLNAYKYMKIYLEAAPLKKTHLFLYAQIFLCEYTAPFQLQAVSNTPWCACVLCRFKTLSFPRPWACRTPPLVLPYQRLEVAFSGVTSRGKRALGRVWRRGRAVPSTESSFPSCLPQCRADPSKNVQQRALDQMHHICKMTDRTL